MGENTLQKAHCRFHLQPRTDGGPCQLPKLNLVARSCQHLDFYLRVRFYDVQDVIGQYRSIVVDALYGHVHCGPGST